MYTLGDFLSKIVIAFICVLVASWFWGPSYHRVEDGVHYDVWYDTNIWGAIIFIMIALKELYDAAKMLFTLPEWPIVTLVIVLLILVVAYYVTEDW